MDSYFQKTKQRSLLWKIAKFLFIVLMILNSAALLISYLARVVDPYIFWFVAFLGLVVPLMMLANIFFLLVLTVRLNRWLFVPLAVLLIGVGYIGDFLQLRLITQYPHQGDDKKNKKELTVMSYNVHSFSQYSSPKTNTLEAVANFISERNPDIICIQEYQVRNKRDSAFLADKFHTWKYQVVSPVIEKGDYLWGVAVFSKFPLAKAKAIKFAGLTNSAMSVDVHIGSDTIRLYNCHLQSTQFNKIGKKRFQDGDVEDAARLLGNTLRQNYRIRAFQADSLARIIAESPYRNILAGDFNDSPMSYVYGKIRGEMKDSFRECGEGYEYTYIPFMKLFRIDYLLHSEGVKTLSYDSPYVTWSDHKPVIAKFRLLTL